MTGLAEGVRTEHERPCTHCGDPLPGFQAVNGNKWNGLPVLYMGIDQRTGYALKYQFCELDCLLEWAAEVQGREVGD